jgi:hypothetical protein
LYFAKDGVFVKLRRDNEVATEMVDTENVLPTLSRTLVAKNESSAATGCGFDKHGDQEKLECTVISTHLVL